MPNQQYLVRGLRKKPLSLAAGIRAQASKLPGIYQMRQNKEFQEAQMEQGRQRLDLGKQELSMKHEQFKKTTDLQNQAADVAKGGMFLKGGLGVGKAMATGGMFDARMESMKQGMAGIGAKFGFGGKPAVAGRINPAAYQKEAAMSPEERGGFKGGKFGEYDQTEPSGPSYGDQFLAGGWKSGLSGGVSGGLMGAGAAKALGAKKKWQTVGAGAAGGLAATWMSGGGNPFSMALGGALGGGLGMLL